MVALLFLVIWSLCSHCAVLMDQRSIKEVHSDIPWIDNLSKNILYSPSTSTDNSGLEYFTFAQTWPPGFCHFNKCKFSRPSNAFSIHGLWPDIWTRKSISYCSGAPAFNDTAILDILEDLKREWVDQKEHYWKLWHYEWKKHGTCAIQQGLLPDQHSYFSTALSLKQRINITDIFERNDVRPSNSTTFHRGTISNILRTKLGIDAELQCEWKHHGVPELVEVRVCVDKGLQLIGCSNSTRRQLALQHLDTEEVGYMKLSWTASCPDNFLISP